MLSAFIVDWMRVLRQQPTENLAFDQRRIKDIEKNGEKSVVPGEVESDEEIERINFSDFRAENVLTHGNYFTLY